MSERGSIYVMFRDGPWVQTSTTCGVASMFPSDRAHPIIPPTYLEPRMIVSLAIPARRHARNLLQCTQRHQLTRRPTKRIRHQEPTRRTEVRRTTHTHTHTRFMLRGMTMRALDHPRKHSLVLAETAHRRRRQCLLLGGVRATFFLWHRIPSTVPRIFTIK